MTSRRFARTTEQEAARAPDALAHDILDALGGGQTRSAVELITDLGVPYDALEGVLGGLLGSRLVELAYESGDERFYRLTDAGIGALDVGAELHDVEPELATDLR